MQLWLPCMQTGRHVAINGQVSLLHVHVYIHLTMEFTTLRQNTESDYVLYGAYAGVHLVSIKL